MRFSTGACSRMVFGSAIRWSATGRSRGSSHRPRSSSPELAHRLASPILNNVSPNGIGYGFAGVRCVPPGRATHPSAGPRIVALMPSAGSGIRDHVLAFRTRCGGVESRPSATAQDRPTDQIKRVSVRSRGPEEPPRPCASTRSVTLGSRTIRWVG